MKKHLLFLFATFATLLASAQTKVEIGGIWYNLVSKTKQAEVTNGDTKYSGSIIIPTRINHEGVQYSVTSIGNSAFYNCKSLTAITIPEGVTSIGRYAFSDCSSLTAVNISDIAAWCSIEFDGYYSNPLFYARNLYHNGELVTELTISKGMTSIGNYAFYYCKSLTAITIPEGVTSIGSQAFYGCSSLTSITIPESVTSIRSGAFAYCISLTAITISESVTSIGERAFNYCSSLTSITIPESVTSIGNSAFEGCSSLTAVHISDIAAWCNIEFSNISSNPLCCAHNLYLNGELVTELTIPGGVTSIGNRAFYGCSSLTAITIPEGVTSIRSSAFYNCSSLTSITIPEGVTSIESSAFYNCSSLTFITIPEGVTSIGDQTFYECSSLPSIIIPESVTSIGRSAFYNCSSLTSIILPKKMRNISSQAFANCVELLDVYCYAKSVPSTYSSAFDGSYPEYATLHVPASALNAYKTTAPWSSFGKFETFEITVENITLDQSTATLTEGETLVLTATVTPDDAADKSILWSSSNPSVATVDNTGKVTAVAPGTATIAAMANDGSGVSTSCEIVVNELILGKCATPTISYKDGEVIFACDTEGVAFVSETTEDVAGNRNETKFAIIPTYTITAYATKTKYENSDEATLTLCWIPCAEEHESEEVSILTISSKPVLISTQGGTITVSRLASGTTVAAYDTSGTQFATATATAGTATLITNLTTGDIAIVKIDGYSIKITIK